MRGTVNWTSGQTAMAVAKDDVFYNEQTDLRNRQARELRALRKANPAIARLLWRKIKILREKALGDMH